MRKFLLFFIFLLIVQFAYSLELLEVVDKVQKKINIKRFSAFNKKYRPYSIKLNKKTLLSSFQSKFKTDEFSIYMRLGPVEAKLS